MRKQWTIFEKVTNDRNFYLFRGPKWPKFCASKAHILHTSKSKCNEQFGAILMWNQWKRFEKVTKHQNFYLICGPKWPRKLGIWRPYCTHLWKQLHWEYKASWLWIQRKHFNKIFEYLDFDSFGGPKWPKSLGLWGPFRTYKGSSNELVNEVSSESSRKCSRKLTKPYILTYFGLIWAQKWTKNLSHRGHFSYTAGSAHNIPVNPDSLSRIKNILRKWPKTSTIIIFCLLCN